MTDISSDAYERILDQSGQFGFYQKRTYFLICALQAICVSLMAYTVYACVGKEPCPIQPEHLEVTTNPPTDNFHLSIYVVYDSNVSSLNYTTKPDSAPTSINRDLVSKTINNYKISISAKREIGMNTSFALPIYGLNSRVDWVVYPWVAISLREGKTSNGGEGKEKLLYRLN